MRGYSRSRGAMAGLAWLAALIALPVGVAAQEPAPVAVPALSAADTAGGVAALAEQIVVLRAVKPLRLTPEQLQALTTAVAGGRERLAQQSQANLKALAALREPVVRARQQLFARGVTPNDPQGAAALVADQPVDAARRAAEQSTRRLQDELVASIQRQLPSLMSPAQLAAMVNQGQAMVMAERQAEDRQREQFRQQMQQRAAQRGATASGMPPGAAAGGGRGGRGGGPGGPGGPGGSQRMLERLRGADAEEFQRMTRGMARRFGDEGTPAYQNAMAAFNSIRSMPDAQFRRQRADLGRQFDTAISSPRSAAATINTENATGMWIRRYLLSPQAPAALKDLSAATRGE